MTTVYAIIPAAGRGARFSTEPSSGHASRGRSETADTTPVAVGNKVFADLCGRPILRWTADAFSDHPRIDRILVVAGQQELSQCEAVLAGVPKIAAIVPGGATRQESVRRGLDRVTETDAIVLVHDAARPLVSRSILDRCLDSVMNFGSAVAGIPVADTLKSVTAEGVAVATVDRSGVWAMQTPQCFLAADLRSAYESASTLSFEGTDEASLIALLPNRSIRIVEGAADNFKVTRLEDLRLAEAVIRSRMSESGNGPAPSPQIRVGFGYDIHPFAPGRRIFLGGVEFDAVDGQGLDGHSDADVLLHAVADAILGAAGLPDIGRLFPNTDSRYKGIESTLLLAEVCARIDALGYCVSNVDATIIAERPRIADKVDAMRERIAETLRVDRGCIGIQATTNEGIGALGSGKGIAAHAVACLVRHT